MRRMDGTKEFKVRVCVCCVCDWARMNASPQGSVFVEFADFKSVGAFLDADPKPTWNGEELLIMSK